MPSRSPLLLALWFTASLAAQTRESIEVRVTQIEVTVLDRAGRPLEGLAPEDFEVRIGGRPAPISNFTAVRNGIVADENRAAAQTAIPTSLVIFIDELHLRQGSRKRAFDALKNYVRANVGPLNMATLIRYSRHFDVRTRPTDKPGYILAELKEIETQPFLGHDDDRERDQIIEEIDELLFGTAVAGGASYLSVAEMVFRDVEQYAERLTAEVDRSLRALENAIELASAFDGRRVLLYVSEGMPQQPGIELVYYWLDAVQKSPNFEARSEVAKFTPGRLMRFDRTAQFKRVAQAAQRGGVTIYSFDAAGLRPMSGRGAEFDTTGGQVSTMLTQANLRSGLQYVSEQTGGRYIANENDVDEALRQISEQFSTYYSIGVRPARNARGDIEVKVKNRSDVRIYAARQRPPLTPEEELEQNVRARLYTRVATNPLNAAIAVTRPATIDGNCVVHVRLQAAPPKVTPELTPALLEIRFVVLNERNDESELRRVNVPFLDGRIAHSMMLRIQPRPHVLSLAVSNPLTGEASYLQADLDGTACR